MAGDSLSSPQPAYLHFSGTLGKRAVSMDLVKDRGFEGVPIYNGTFSFDSEQEPIPVYSDGGDTLTAVNLYESGISEDRNGRFSGKFQDGVFEGIYTSGEGKKEKFVLRISEPSGGMKFRFLQKDTLFLAMENLKAPNARFSWHFLQPEEAWLLDSLLTELHGDSLVKAGKGNPAAVFRELGNQYAKDYRESVEPFLPEDSINVSLNYDLNYGMEVLFNRNQLLSIALTQYQYSGGAHGMMYTQCHSFDLNAKKKIRMTDVFKPGYLPGLKAAINKAARKKYKVSDLSEALLVAEIEPNENFYLTGKGICFVFQPYEIGPYSMGEQHIYLPYSQIKDIVK